MVQETALHRVVQPYGSGVEEQFFLVFLEDGLQKVRKVAVFEIVGQCEDGAVHRLRLELCHGDVVLRPHIV